MTFGSRVTETVTLINPGDRDRTGDPIAAAADNSEDGWIFYPDSVTEDTDRRETTVLSGHFIIPATSAATSVMQVQRQDGTKFRIVGVPLWGSANPISGYRRGKKLIKVEAVI